MRVVKWGKGLAVPLPGDVAHALGLREGDEVQLEAAGTGSLSVARPDPDPDREAALATLRALARPGPPGFRFSREDANARGRDEPAG